MKTANIQIHPPETLKHIHKAISHAFHCRPHLQGQICQPIMKLALSTPLLAFISPLALSALLSPDQYDNFWRFIPIASDTLDGLNLRGINANSRHFWIGKATSTYCPVRDYPCPPGNETVLDVSSGGASLVRSPYSWYCRLVS